MSGRTRLDPKEHIPGEWNIILLNRYMPLSNGDHERELAECSTKYKVNNPELLRRAHELYDNGATQREIARQVGVSQPTVSLWASRGFQVEV